MSLKLSSFLFNMSCIKIFHQMSNFLAFLSMAVATVLVPIRFGKWKRYRNSSIKWKNYIVNLSIDLIYLMLLINRGLINEAIEHLDKIINTSKIRIQNTVNFITQITFFFVFISKRNAFQYKQLSEMSMRHCKKDFLLNNEELCKIDLAPLDE